MERVLVTGGAGFIGGYVVEELTAAGKTPVVYDYRRLHRKNSDVEAELFLGDIRDEVTVNQAMAHVDSWIHLAAVLGTQETITNPRPAALSNIQGGLNVLESADQFGLPGVYIGVGNHWMNNTSRSPKLPSNVS